MLDLLAPVDCEQPAMLAALYEQLRPFALSKTQYLTGDLGVAQDIVQDVFESLCGRPLVFPTKQMAYQWVYRSCHNRGIDFLRNRKRRLELLDNTKPVLIAEPKTPQDRLANQQLLAKIIAKLDRRQAEVLGYIAVDGLSHGEIAMILDVSTKTIQRSVEQIQKILAQFREAL